MSGALVDGRWPLSDAILGSRSTLQVTQESSEYPRKMFGTSRPVSELLLHLRRETPIRRHADCSRLPIPIALRIAFSKKGSLTPRFIFIRKYFSRAILARWTHLPFFAQVTLRGAI